MSFLTRAKCCYLCFVFSALRFIATLEFSLAFHTPLTPQAVTMKGKEIEASLKMVALVVHLCSASFVARDVQGAEGSAVKGWFRTCSEKYSSRGGTAGGYARKGAACETRSLCPNLPANLSVCGALPIQKATAWQQRRPSWAAAATETGRAATASWRKRSHMRSRAASCTRWRPEERYFFFLSAVPREQLFRRCCRCTVFFFKKTDL